MKNICKKNGFTLVEFMIVFLITVFGLFVMTEVQLTGEQIKKGSQGNQSAQFNGLAAAQLLDQGIKKSGFGFGDPAVLGATINYFSPTAAAMQTETLAPVVISPDGNNVRLRMMWSTANMNIVPIQLIVAKTAGADAQISNIYGLSPGDLMLYAEPSKTSTVQQISSVINASLTVQHNVSALYPYNTNFAAVYPAAGYAVGAKIFNLGQWERQDVRVLSGQLLLRQRIGNTDTETVLAENVMGLQAVYGMDNGVGGTANDGVPDQWLSASPTTAAGWAQVVAIRYAVLTRNKEMEKNTVTSAAPTWSGGTFNMTGLTNWGLYRYRVYEGTTPIRNAVWTVSS
jgi:type IV pilus assembly protein PilW